MRLNRGDRAHANTGPGRGVERDVHEGPVLRDHSPLKRQTARSGLHDSIKAFLDCDKVEASRTAIQGFVHTHIDVSADSHDKQLLTILSKALTIFTTDDDESLEETAREFLNQLRDNEFGSTKTYKRLSALLAICQEAKDRVAKILKKMENSKKGKLPEDYYNPSSQNLNSETLITHAQKRTVFQEVKSELAGLSDYSKNGIFSNFRKKLGIIRSFRNHSD